MIARGLLYPEAADLLKEIYVDVCADDFRLNGKRLTDSRISVLTGLQRKDIRGIRARLDAEHGDDGEIGAGPIPRVIARWTAGPPFASREGTPKPLPRTAGGKGSSFDELVASVSRDIHPRTILDELIRQGLVLHDADADSLQLLREALVPSRDEEGLMGYFGANLGDHAEAAAANIGAAPEPGPFFERAVYYNQLSPASLKKLDQRARKLQSTVLAQLNRDALKLQEQDKGAKPASGRFRCGAYIYTTPDDESEDLE